MKGDLKPDPRRDGPAECGSKRLAKWAFGTLGLFVGVLALYAATVGLVPAVGRHVGDGRLQWLKSSPSALKALQAYRIPADYLSKVPLARSLFELSGDFWCAVTSAPETT